MSMLQILSCLEKLELKLTHHKFCWMGQMYLQNV